MVWTCCAGCGKKKRDCEFVFLTCHANFDYAKTALQYGAADYITKPFNIAQTEATLSKVASQVRYHQAALQKVAGQQWRSHSLARHPPARIVMDEP